jgi:hypothetical protein
MKVPRHARVIAVAALGYTAAAVAYTWPLAITLSGVPHDLGDPLLTTWFLWWSSTQAVALTDRWWNAPMFYPATGVLAFSEHLLGLTPIAAPLILLTGQPLIGHNVAFIATFVLSALGAHWLAYTLTGRHDVSVLAALAFAFAPYRLPQTPHIQVLASHWTPICLAALHHYDRTARPRWAVAAAAAWVLQALSCGYYLMFVAVLGGLWFLWFGAGRWTLRQIAIAAAAFGCGALLLAPFLLGYQTILHDTYNLRRGIGEIRFFSADIAALLYASDELLAWSWLQVFPRAEGNLFPGVTIVALTMFAVYRSHPFRGGAIESRRMRITRRALLTLFALLVVATAVPLAYGAWRLTVGGITLLSIARADKPATLALLAGLATIVTLPQVHAAIRRRSTLAFYLLAAFAMWLFALGPDPTVMGHRALYRSIYSWLMELPGFDGLRVPARFWMMTLVCLSVVAALAIDRLSGHARRIVVVVAAVGLLIDGWPRDFRVLAAPSLRPAPAGVSVRLNLPIDDVSEPLALYQQMFDSVPLYNGFSGYGAPHYFPMRQMIEDEDPRILPALAAAGPLGVVVDHAGDADGKLRRLVLAVPGATVERMERDWSSYRVPKTLVMPDVPDRAGTPVPIKSLTAFPNAAAAPLAIDGKSSTRWWTGDEIEKKSELTIELDSPGRVSQIVMELGGFTTDVPKRLQIDASADGAAWEIVWSGSPALQAYFGAIRDPRQTPIVLPLNRDHVRFLRLRETETSKWNWTIFELQVLR